MEGEFALAGNEIVLGFGCGCDPHDDHIGYNYTALVLEIAFNE